MYRLPIVGPECFKYDKTRESLSPFIRKESQIQAEAAKAGLENSLATQTYCEGG